LIVLKNLKVSGHRSRHLIINVLQRN